MLLTAREHLLSQGTRQAAPCEATATKSEPDSNSDLIARLLLWAKIHPEGQELCALPKLKWVRGEDEVVYGLTIFQSKEHEASRRLGFILTPVQAACWWYEILDLGRKLVRCTTLVATSASLVLS